MVRTERRQFPEIDRGGWFDRLRAVQWITKGQRPIIETFYRVIRDLAVVEIETPAEPHRLGNRIRAGFPRSFFSFGYVYVRVTPTPWRSHHLQ